MDKRDIAKQASFPSVMVPSHGELELPTKAGERLLIASNGIFLEVNRAWARFVRKVGDEIKTPLPYGRCSVSTAWKIPAVPVHLLREFNALARDQADREIGASIIWNEVSGYRLAPVQSLDASGAHLRYLPPPMSSTDHLIIDCHSHAGYAAGFSSTDNTDDAWCVKLAYVVGHCGRPQQSVAMRLCIKGIFEKTNLDLQ